MPKIIEDLKVNILAEAKKQLLANGYSGMTLRSVAEACGIAVGTIYNYFPSKDMLIASFMLGDWNDTLTNMGRICESGKDARAVLGGIYSELVAYNEKYGILFRDSTAHERAAGIFGAQHIRLRSQIASLIRGTCAAHAKCFTPDMPDFVAESILLHTSERNDFPALWSILGQLFSE